MRFYFFETVRIQVMVLSVLRTCVLVKELAGSVYAKDGRRWSPQNVGYCVPYRKPEHRSLNA
jgi:hypothetical protein